MATDGDPTHDVKTGTVAPGQVVTIDVYAQVFGSGTLGFGATAGAFASGNGGLHGNIAAAGGLFGSNVGVGINGFNGTGSAVGSIVDIWGGWRHGPR